MPPPRRVQDMLSDPLMISMEECHGQDCDARMSGAELLRDRSRLAAQPMQARCIPVVIMQTCGMHSGTIVLLFLFFYSLSVWSL